MKCEHDCEEHRGQALAVKELSRMCEHHSAQILTLHEEYRLEIRTLEKMCDRLCDALAKARLDLKRVVLEHQE